MPAPRPAVSRPKAPRWNGSSSGSTTPAARTPPGTTTGPRGPNPTPALYRRFSPGPSRHPTTTGRALGTSSHGITKRLPQKCRNVKSGFHCQKILPESQGMDGSLLWTSRSSIYPQSQDLVLQKFLPLAFDRDRPDGDIRGGWKVHDLTICKHTVELRRSCRQGRYSKVPPDSATHPPSPPAGANTITLVRGAAYGGLHFGQRSTADADVEVRPTGEPATWRIRLTRPGCGSLTQDPGIAAPELQDLILMVGYSWE